MKIDSNNYKKLIVAVLFFFIVATIVVTAVILVGINVVDNINKRYSFKQDIIIENINQKINVKDLLVYKNINSQNIDIETNKENIVSVEDTFISLNNEGCAEIEINIKEGKKLYKDKTTIVVVDNVEEVGVLRKFLSFDNITTNTILLNERIDFKASGELSEFAKFTFSNSFLKYDEKTKTLIGIKEGKTTVTGSVTYQTLNSLKPINICASVDLFVESKINSLDIKVLDENFIEADTINYNTKQSKINGYFEIDGVRQINPDNLSMNFNFCECEDIICKDGKLLIPFKMHNWGIVNGKISYNGKQGNFEKEITFEAYNETYTSKPLRLSLKISKSEDVVFCWVDCVFEGKITNSPFSVYFIRDGIETKPTETTYISEFEVDTGLILFKAKDDDSFHIKIVLDNVPIIYQTMEII